MLQCKVRSKTSIGFESMNARYQSKTEMTTAPILFFFTTARTPMVRGRLQDGNTGCSEQYRKDTISKSEYFELDHSTTSVVGASRYKA
jgi:hypothetical protein